MSPSALGHVDALGSDVRRTNADAQLGPAATRKTEKSTETVRCVFLGGSVSSLSRQLQMENHHWGASSSPYLRGIPRTELQFSFDSHGYMFICAAPVCFRMLWTFSMPCMCWRRGSWLQNPKEFAEGATHLRLLSETTRGVLYFDPGSGLCPGPVWVTQLRTYLVCFWFPPDVGCRDDLYVRRPLLFLSLFQ